MNRSPRTFIIIGAILAACLLSAAIFTAVRSQSMGSVSLVVVPDDSTVLTDGVAAPKSLNLKVSAGKHTIKVSRKGFAVQTKSFTIKSGEKQSYNFYLEPNGPDGYIWRAQHPNEALAGETYAGQQFDKANDIATKENPIMKDLPTIGSTYQIDYGTSVAHPDKQGAIAIYITASTDQGKQDALDWFAAFGYKPKDYEIIYQATP
jgi:hypothetical protein